MAWIVQHDPKRRAWSVLNERGGMVALFELEDEARETVDAVNARRAKQADQAFDELVLMEDI